MLSCKYTETCKVSVASETPHFLLVTYNRTEKILLLHFLKVINIFLKKCIKNIIADSTRGDWEVFENYSLQVTPHKTMLPLMCLIIIKTIDTLLILLNLGGGLSKFLWTGKRQSQCLVQGHFDPWLDIGERPASKPPTLGFMVNCQRLYLLCHASLIVPSLEGW